MYRAAVGVLLVLLFSAVSGWAFYTQTPLYQDPRIEVGTNGEEHVRGELLVKFRPGTSDVEISHILRELKSQRLLTHSNVDFQRVAVAPGKTVPEMCQLFQALPQVEYAEPNYIARVQFVPNDGRYSSQWGPACIGAEQAWDRSQGNHSIIVAVLDTGCDLDHPDLRDNVDTAIDYDFVNNDADATDDFGHGTHVSGIIAAEINNSVGIAGLQQARLMEVKVASSLGTATMSDMIAGINYAVEHGARVINMSLGSTSSSTGLQQACDNAYNAGVLIVAAAETAGTADPHIQPLTSR